MPALPTASQSAVRAEPAVSAAGLHRAFGDRWVLRDLELSLPHGQTLAVIGPNGAGKTTFLRIVATLLRPTAGEITVLGCELPGQGWGLRGRIGYLGHEPLLYRDLTATENLRFHARLFGIGEPGSRIEELLEQVGLAHRAATRIAEMSAGMIQRLAVCRCVLHRPELLVLDEPLAHLDPAAAAAVAPLIGPAPDRTRLLVTHDLDAALADADRVLALDRDGAVAYQGPASGLADSDARAIYADPGPRR